MRALIVGSDRPSSWAVEAELIEAGFSIVGHARSSGEAILLAGSGRPDVAVLSVNLESMGAGERLASVLKARHSTHCILTANANEQASDDDYLDQSDPRLISEAAVRHRKQREQLP